MSGNFHMVEAASNIIQEFANQQLPAIATDPLRRAICVVENPDLKGELSKAKVFNNCILSLMSNGVIMCPLSEETGRTCALMDAVNSKNGSFDYVSSGASGRRELSVPLNPEATIRYGVSPEEIKTNWTVFKTLQIEKDETARTNAKKERTKEIKLEVMGVPLTDSDINYILKSPYLAGVTLFDIPEDKQIPTNAKKNKEKGFILNTSFDLMQAMGITNPRDLGHALFENNEQLHSIMQDKGVKVLDFSEIKGAKTKSFFLFPQEIQFLREFAQSYECFSDNNPLRLDRAIELMLGNLEYLIHKEEDKQIEKEKNTIDFDKNEPKGITDQKLKIQAGIKKLIIYITSKCSIDTTTLVGSINSSSSNNSVV